MISSNNNVAWWGLLALAALLWGACAALNKYDKSTGRDLMPLSFFIGWTAFTAPLIAIALSIGDSVHGPRPLGPVDFLGFFGLAWAVGALMYFTTIRPLYRATSGRSTATGLTGQ